MKEIIDWGVYNEKYVKNLESQIADLKSQLANIRYLNADEVRQILLTVDLSTTGREHLPKITRALDAICNLAIDIDRDKIIITIMGIVISNLSNDCLKVTPGILAERIANKIIKAIRGEE